MRAGWSGKSSPTRQVYTAIPVSWQTRFVSRSAISTLRRMVSRTRCPGTDVSRPRASASASRRSCGMSFSAHTYRWAAASSTAPARSTPTVLTRISVTLIEGVSRRRPFCGRAPGAPAEHRALQQRVAHHPVAAVRPARDLAAGEHAFERRLAVLVDHEAAVLVVEHRIGEDRLAQGVDATGAIAAQHVREGDLGVGLRNAGRVEIDRRAAVLRRHASSLLDLLEDGGRDCVARPERVGELLAVGVDEDGAVGARRLGDGIALHVPRPRAAVRVVLQSIEVAGFGAEIECNLGHLAGRAGMVRRELATFLGFSVAAPARRQDDGARCDLDLPSVLAPAGGDPAAPGGAQAGQRMMGEGRSTRALEGLAQGLGDCVARAIADLE